jgi:deoxyribodipyrimidine photolyase-related protein
MVPNIYGMSQFATNIMMTRPYFSSTNYIHKMSSFKKSDNSEWINIWNALYYSFINDHSKFLSSNYGSANMLRHWTNKDNKEKNELLIKAKKYLKILLN